MPALYGGIAKKGSILPILIKKSFIILKLLTKAHGSGADLATKTRNLSRTRSSPQESTTKTQIETGGYTLRKT